MGAAGGAGVIIPVMVSNNTLGLIIIPLLWVTNLILLRINV